MFAWQFAQMLAISDGRGWAKFVTMQNHYNLLYREEGAGDESALPRGGRGADSVESVGARVLAGNRKASTTRARTDDFGTKLYGKNLAEADQRIVDRVEELGRQRGIPAAQIALAWLLHQPEVVAPIVGASKPHHLEDAVASVSVEAERGGNRAAEEPYLPHEIAGHE